MRDSNPHLSSRLARLLFSTNTLSSTCAALDKKTQNKFASSTMTNKMMNGNCMIDSFRVVAHTASSTTLSAFLAVS
jgi:hypothetical protein